MRKAIVFLLTTIVLFSTKSLCQPNDIDAIKKLNSKWLDAIVQRDTAALSSVLANDFILINPGGRKQTKADNLANVLAPNHQVTSVHIDSAEVRMIDANVGIISAWTTFVIKAGDKETTGKNCYQDVYIKRQGRWYAVSAHVTLLGMN